MNNFNQYCNKAYIKGRVLSITPIGEDKQLLTVATKRRSEFEDVIKVEGSLEQTKDIQVSNSIVVLGRVWTRNIEEQEQRRLHIFVDADEIYKQTQNDKQQDANDITIVGTICRNPIYRLTPFGREITDILIALNDDEGNSAYLPSILWGKTALWASANLQAGDRVWCDGRLQSRQYEKQTEDGPETKMAWELSIKRLHKERSK